MKTLKRIADWWRWRRARREFLIWFGLDLNNPMHRAIIGKGMMEFVAAARESALTVRETADMLEALSKVGAEPV